MSTSIAALASGEHSRKTFYPTPEELAKSLLREVDFSEGVVRDILEPSAGKGDLAYWSAFCLAYGGLDAYERFCSRYGMRQDNRVTCEHVDCIEIDPDLRSILNGSGWRVIHDDFLTFETQKRYDLIVMNPPFDRGDAHLLKAIDLMRHGGQIACILNAETLRNPYSAQRQQLLKLLQQYGAHIRYVGSAFADAERETDVDVALINLTIPREKYDSTIIDDMRRAPTWKQQKVPNEYAEVVRYNQIDEWVNRYNFEVACGTRLIEEYDSLKPNMMFEDIDPDSDMNNAILCLSVRVPRAGSEGSLFATVNNYIRAVRAKYWQALFENSMITSLLTSNLLDELRSDVRKLEEYEFSAYNILTLITAMSRKMVSGVEQTIMRLFDEWTYKYHWSEGTENRHYFDGWKTNDCFRVGRKVIIPLYTFSQSNGRYESWRVIEKFRDIEKAFDFLDSGNTDWGGDMVEILRNVERTQQTRNIDTKYFTVTFYKKGTAHLVFKDEKLLEKFNLFASLKKGWLPPNYGKARYEDMTEEERHVVDSFQGREKYEEVLRDSAYYLASGEASPLLLNTAN